MKNKLWKRIQVIFWFIHIDPWHMWKYFFKHGPRIQIFRNRRYPKGAKNWKTGESIAGKRMYVHYRWGGQLLGLTVGDRGGSKDYYQRRLG